MIRISIWNYIISLVIANFSFTMEMLLTDGTMSEF